MADAKVSKTFDHNGRVGSTPTFGTTIPSSNSGFQWVRLPLSYIDAAASRFRE